MLCQLHVRFLSQGLNRIEMLHSFFAFISSLLHIFAIFCLQTVGLIHQSRDQIVDYNDHRRFLLNFRFNFEGLISDVKVGYRSSKTKCVVFFMRNVALDVKKKMYSIQFIHYYSGVSVQMNWLTTMAVVPDWIYTFQQRPLLYKEA